MTLDEMREAARAIWASDDLEIDDEAAVSKMDANQGGDNGFWVAAWVWVPKESIDE